MYNRSLRISVKYDTTGFIGITFCFFIKHIKVYASLLQNKIKSGLNSFIATVTARMTTILLTCFQAKWLFAAHSESTFTDSTRLSALPLSMYPWLFWEGTLRVVYARGCWATPVIPLPIHPGRADAGRLALPLVSPHIA